MEGQQKSFQSIAEVGPPVTDVNDKSCDVYHYNKEANSDTKNLAVNGHERRKYSRDFILEKQRTELALRRPKDLIQNEIVLSVPHALPYNQSIKSREQTSGSGFKNCKRQFTISSPCHNTRKNIAQESPLRQIPKYVKINLSPKQHRNRSENPFNIRRNKLHFDSLDGAESRKAQVQKKCRSCLNKITPENFQSICSKNFTSDLIQSHEDLEIVVNEIYEKVLRDIKYGALYTRLCIYIDNLETAVIGRSNKCTYLMIMKCQNEFETSPMEKIDCKAFDEKIAIAKSESDKNRVAELLAEREYQLVLLRGSSLANINFIGELHLAKVIHLKPIVIIINSLLRDSCDDEKVEWLVLLLNVIGPFFEPPSAAYDEWFNEVFRELHAIVESRTTSSRVRFLIINLLDLRCRNWAGRIDKEKPVTKAQLQNTTCKEDARTFNGNAYASNFQGQYTQDGKCNLKSSHHNGSNSPMQSVQCSTVNKHDGCNSLNIVKQALNSIHSQSSKEKDMAIRLEKYTCFISVYENVRAESIKLLKLYISHISEGSVTEKKDIYKLVRLLQNNVYWFVKSTLPWIVEQKADAILIFKDLLVDLVKEKHIPTNVLLDEFTLIMDTVEDLKIDIPIVSKYLGTILGAHIASKCLTFDSLSPTLKAAGDAKAEIFCHMMNEVLTKMNLDEIVLQMITPGFDLGEIFDDPRYLRLLEENNLGKLRQFITIADKWCEHLLEPLIELFKMENSNDKIYDFIEHQCCSTKSKKFIRVLVTAFVDSMVIPPQCQSDAPEDEIPSNNPSTLIEESKLSKFALRRLNRLKCMQKVERESFSLPKYLKTFCCRKIEVLQKYVNNSGELELESLYSIQASTTKYKHPKDFFRNLLDLLYTNNVVTADTLFIWIRSDDPNEANGRDSCILSAKYWIDYKPALQKHPSWSR